jgi:hypothetical protein
MKWLLVAPVVFTLAGCVSESNAILHQSEAVKPEQRSIEQPQVAPASNNVLRSPAARAAAPAGENLRGGQLSDCVTKSCKINCSSKVAKQFRPKWCAGFKEPAE